MFECKRCGRPPQEWDSHDCIEGRGVMGTLPDCMIPDGGDGACEAYREALDRIAALRERAEAAEAEVMRLVGVEEAFARQRTTALRLRAVVEAADNAEDVAIGPHRLDRIGKTGEESNGFYHIPVREWRLVVKALCKLDSMKGGE